MRRLAPVALLLLLPACKLKRQEAPAIYAPWEEGCTLGYEDPTLPTAELQRGSRIQVRVAEGLLDPEKPGLVKLTRGSLGQAPVQDFLRVEEGGVELLTPEGKHLDWVLPKGFPDRVTRWNSADGKVEFRVLGPGAWGNPAKVKAIADPVGVWIEVSGPGLRRRALLLRGVGEVEVATWREDRWITVSRLVDKGWTDDQSTKPK